MIETDYTTTNKKMEICQMKGCTNLVEVYIRKYSSPPRILSMSICNSYLKKGNWEKELK